MHIAFVSPITTVLKSKGTGPFIVTLSEILSSNDIMRPLMRKEVKPRVIQFIGAKRASKSGFKVAFKTVKIVAAIKRLAISAGTETPGIYRLTRYNARALTPTSNINFVIPRIA